MLSLKEKNRIKRIISAWPSLILLTFIILLVGKGVWTVWQSEKISRQNRQISVSHYQDLQNKKDNLLQEIEQLQTAEGIEAEIREKFRVVKAGEQLAIILHSDEEVEKKETKPVSLWFKFWNFLLRGSTSQ